MTLQWRHNERDGVSNDRRLGFLLNHLFRGRSKKTSKLRVTGLCEGNSPVNGEFPAQRASKGEKCFHLMTSSWILNKSKSKKTLFNVGQCKQYNISSHLKWVLVADKTRAGYGDPQNELTSFTNPGMHLQKIFHCYKTGKMNWILVHHNAPFRTEMCTFLFWMEHYGIWNRCILGYVILFFGVIITWKGFDLVRHFP